MKPSVALSENNRLSTLQGYEILDTISEKAYDELTYLASHICETPIALISLVDENRQWFKSKIGLDANETARDISFCAHAILSEEDIFMVPNAQKDERFQSNPLVTGKPHIAFYAGAPLRAPNGEKLGTLCVIDTNQRTLNESQTRSLRYLANQVMNLMELSAAEKQKNKHLEAELAFEKAQLKSKNEILLGVQKYEELVKTMPVGIALLEGPQHIYKLTNQTHDKILGHKPGLIGTPIHKAVSETFDTGIIDLLDEVYRTGKPYYSNNTPLTFNQPDGSKKDFFLSFAYHPTRNSAGQIDGILATVVDVTDTINLDHKAKEYTKKAKAAEMRLQEAVNVAEIGFIDWNMISNQTLMSEKFLEQWGQNPGASVQELFSQILDEDKVIQEGIYRKALSGKAPYSGEFRVRRVHDEKVVWLKVHGTVTFDEKNTPVRYFGTCLDITVQKNSQQALEDARSAAERANKTKTVFLANMSHEIRTPLGAIIGFADQIRGPETSPEQAHQFLDVIHRNAEHLLKLVEDILDLSKIEAGKIVLEEDLVNLADFISETKSTLQYRAQEKGLDFWVTTSSSLPQDIKVDVTRLRQILTNVVGNAFKFTHKGSVHLDFRTDQNYLVMTVKDTGIGLDSAEAAKLFEPFQQADLSAKRKYGGTGLGLALTRRIAETMGGSFMLTHSRLGQGSTFEVKIRIASSLQKNPVDLSATIKTNSGLRTANSLNKEPLKILLVEDSTDNQILFNLVLTRLGLKVELAKDGLEAIELVQKNNYDLILCDIQMPRMDGYETKAMLDQMSIKTPVYALTAHAMKEERDRCLRAGFKGFLTKPLDKVKLAEVLETIRK